MRRRAQSELVEPPGRLLAYDPADWLPLIDPAGYDPDNYRNRRGGVPYGEPYLSADNWRRSEARRLWVRERLDWCQRFGWPGGLGVVDLLRQCAADRRRSAGQQR